MNTLTNNRAKYALALLFMGGAALVFVPRPYSTLLFAALVMISLGLGLREGGQTLRRFRDDFLRVLRWMIMPFQWMARVSGWLRAKVGAQVGLTLAIVACVLIAWSAYELRPERAHEDLRGAARALLFGGLALGMALYFTPEKLLAEQETSITQITETVQKVSPRVRVLRWSALIIGIACLGGLAYVNGLPLRVSPIYVHGQFALLVFGVIGVTLGLLLFPATHIVVGARHASPLPASQQRQQSNFGAWLALAAVLLLALILRFYNLELIHRYVDEIHWFDAVPRIWDFPELHMLVPFSTVTAFTWVYPYLESWLVGALGPSFTAIRILSAIVGTLTVGALYWLASMLFNRKIALLAALLLATFPPHLQFSRIALNNVADPLFGTLALALLARGLKYHKRSAFILAGTCLGLTQYFYEGGRLLFPPLVIAFGVLYPLPASISLKDKIRHFVSVRLKNIALLLLTAALIAMPVYYTLYSLQAEMTVRLNSMGFGSGFWQNVLVGGYFDDYVQHLLTIMLGYVQFPETGWFYGGNTALLLTFMTPFFLLGLWHAFWRWREPGMLLALLWLGGTTIGVSFLRDLWSARYVVAFPALMLITALGIHLTLQLLAPVLGMVRDTLRENDAAADKRSIFQRTYARAVGRVAVVIALLLSIAQVNYYFGAHQEVYRHQFRFGADVYDALFRAVLLPTGTHVHIVTDSLLFSFDVNATVRFWNRQNDIVVHVIAPPDFNVDYLTNLPPDRPHAFFITPWNQPALNTMHQFFITEPPVGSPWDFSTPEEYQYMLYYSPPGAERSGN